MMKLATTGLWLLGAITLLALFALPVHAGPWTRFDYESTWSGFAYIDGNQVPGTWTAKTSYDHRQQKDDLHFKGHVAQHFESADGSIVGHAVSNFNYRLRDGQLRTYTRTYHVNFTQVGVGLVQRTKVTQHSTYNANGELTASVHHYYW